MINDARGVAWLIQPAGEYDHRDPQKARFSDGAEPAVRDKNLSASQDHQLWCGLDHQHMIRQRAKFLGCRDIADLDNHLPFGLLRDGFGDRFEELLAEGICVGIRPQGAVNEWFLRLDRFPVELAIVALPIDAGTDIVTRGLLAAREVESFRR